ncbi:MAG TPA: HAD family hydrolase [Anaerolineaceae bacterium]|nr:HAD family hydrolase [Anaerolineaceae bacterium]
MPSSPFSVVLFDLGSTLIYFDAVWSEMFPRANADLINALHAAGIMVKADAFASAFNQGLDNYRQERDNEFIEHSTLYVLRKLLEEHGYPNVPEEILRNPLKAMYAVSQAAWRIEDDTHATLRALRQQGYRLGLISNAADDADIQTLVDNHGLRPYFEIILSSAAVGWRKPHPRIFALALEHFGVKPQQAVMVGDTLGADILGANNLGMGSVWITRRADVAANHAHEDTIQPDAVIHTLSELPGLLAHWDARPTPDLSAL